MVLSTSFRIAPGNRYTTLRAVQLK